MLINQNKQKCHHDIHSSSTLFEFLKRKKKLTLQTSLQQSREKQNTDSLNNIINDISKTQSCFISPCQQYEDTCKQILKGSSIQQHQTIPINSKVNKIITNLQHVFFCEDKDQKKKRYGRSSFIQMISPMKRKMTVPSVTPNTSIIQNQKKSQKNSNPQQTFYHKNLKKSIKMLKQTLHNLLTSAKFLKQKWHPIIIQFKPLLKFAQQSSSHSIVAAQTSQLKVKLPAFEKIINQFCLINENQIIQQFDKSVTDNLIGIQQSLKYRFQKNQLLQWQKEKDEKKKRIEELQNLIIKLERSIQTLNKKLQKSYQQSEVYKSSSEYHQVKDKEDLSSKIYQVQQKIVQYQQQINTLNQQVSSYKLLEKKLHKTIRELKFDKQQSQRRLLQENTQVKGTREQFLLTEMSTLKKQFKDDVEQLTSLYISKEKQHKTVIQQLQKQLKEVQNQRLSEKQILNKNKEESAIDKKSVQKYKKQNQHLINDLHRMNQELYQHWLALKDIKILAVRLKIFNKFVKIYEDLAFNEQLFL